MGGSNAERRQLLHIFQAWNGSIFSIPYREGGKIRRIFQPVQIGYTAGQIQAGEFCHVLFGVISLFGFSKSGGYRIVQNGICDSSRIFFFRNWHLVAAHNQIKAVGGAVLLLGRNLNHIGPQGKAINTHQKPVSGKVGFSSCYNRTGVSIDRRNRFSSGINAHKGDFQRSTVDITQISRVIFQVHICVRGRVGNCGRTGGFPIHADDRSVAALIWDV